MQEKKRAKATKSHSLKKHTALIPGYFMLTLWVGFALVVLIWVIGASLSTSNEIFQGNIFDFESGFHFENYARVWSVSNLSTYFMNSLFYAAISCALLIVLCAPYAYVLQRFTFPGSQLIKTLLAATTGVPVMMVIIPLYMVIARAELLNNAFSNRIVLIVMFVVTKIPYTTIFLMAYFENISSTYEEAAAIDGCHPIKTFWKIVFPMAQSGLITVTLFNFVGVWNEYLMSLIFTNSNEVKPLALGIFSIVDSMRYSADWGGLFAGVIIAFLPSVIIYVFLSKYIISGLSGGIKG